MYHNQLGRYQMGLKREGRERAMDNSCAVELGLPEGQREASEGPAGGRETQSREDVYRLSQGHAALL